MVASLVTLCECVFDVDAHSCEWLKLRPRLEKLLENKWTIDCHQLDICIKYIFKVLDKNTDMYQRVLEHHQYLFV